MGLNFLTASGVLLGVLAALVGTVMFLVAAFRQNILWGLGSLFVPFVSLIFTVVHWAEAKQGFLISLAGSLLACGVLFATPEVRSALEKEFPSLHSATDVEKARDLTAEIQKERDLLESLLPRHAAALATLSRDYKDLEARRKSLKPADTAAIAKFNEEAALYQTQNAGANGLQLEIAKATESLNTLLAKRSKIQATQGSGRRIVMYTTASCPACKAAKQYCAQKGIRYEEMDVERSPTATEEFQRLGGRGVPLILVGEKRLEGFSPQAFEAML